jgi:hypothetical protein
MVGQVDEASEESSIKQHQTDQIYKAHWIYRNSREYDIEDDCQIYEIFLENDITHYVTFGQIDDIIGDEEWGMATGRSQLLVQYCLTSNHLSFLWSKEEGSR